MLNTHDKVLIVFGAGHRMELAAVLEDMLGKPAFTQPGGSRREASLLPLTERQIVEGRFGEKKGVVLQPVKSGRDFYVEKRGDRFCVTHYRYAHVFREGFRLDESCFASVEEVNAHLAPFFR